MRLVVGPVAVLAKDMTLIGDDRQAVRSKAGFAAGFDIGDRMNQRGFNPGTEPGGSIGKILRGELSPGSTGVADTLRGSGRLRGRLLFRARRIFVRRWRWVRTVPE